MTFHNIFSHIVLTSITSAFLILLIIGLVRWSGNESRWNWRYILWLSVFIHLLWPWGQGSQWSLLTFTDINILVEGQEQALIEPPHEVVADEGVISVPSFLHPSMSSHRAAFFSQNFYWGIAEIAWFLGFIYSLVRWLYLDRLFLNRLFLRSTVNSHKGIQQLLEECKERFCIRRTITIRWVRHDHSPFLCGIFRPTIFMPEQLLSSYNHRQLRHIICHELAHYQRRDIPVNVLVRFLVALHWFNPLIFIAARNLKNEQEIAADRLTLRRLGREEARRYGKTLIEMAEMTSQARFGICVNMASKPNLIKRRVQMIANYNNVQNKWTFAGLGILILINILALTVFSPPSQAKADNQSVQSASSLHPHSLYAKMYGYDTKSYQSQLRFTYPYEASPDDDPADSRMEQMMNVIQSIEHVDPQYLNGKEIVITKYVLNETFGQNEYTYLLIVEAEDHNNIAGDNIIGGSLVLSDRVTKNGITYEEATLHPLVHKINFREIGQGT
ncbi:M56 family metallopeptidase [Paenibacillus tarimensis]